MKPLRRVYSQGFKEGFDAGAEYERKISAALVKLMPEVLASLKHFNQDISLVCDIEAALKQYETETREG